MIFTTHGEMDEALLEKREGNESHPDADVHWVEYWLGNELVHRSVHAALKGREMKIEQERIGG
jgi:hypothetical protein